MRTKIKEYLDQKAVVVDVRSPEEFRGGHNKGSINIPVQILEDRLDELDKEKPLIVCCASGGRSASALRILKHHGFQHVLDAGPWQNVGL